MRTLARSALPLLLVASSLASLGASATHGAPQAPAQPPVFGAAVEIVRLDVIVLDREGKPVSGLTRDDFIVEEGGRSQSIESFEPVVVEARPLPPVTEPPRVSAARIRTPAEGRAFYVFFDDAHVTAAPSEYVRVALRRFIRNELREGDWITAMAPQQGLWWTARNAWEYRQLESVVDRLKGQYVRDPGAKFGMSGLSDFQAMCIVEGLPTEMCGVRAVSGADLGAPAASGGGGGGSGGAGGTGGGAAGGGSGSSSGGGADRVMGVGRSNTDFLAEEVYARARRRIDLTFAGLRQALDSLVPLRGHKSLLLISEGFVLVPDMPGYRELVDTARRANVALHFFDPRGLESGYGEEEPPGLGWATKRLLDTAGGDDLAGATGGRTIVSNDPGEGLRRIAAESEAYYLLGYQPGEAKAGERKVKVRVRREGLSVRARSRYFVAGAPKPGAQPSKKDEAGRSPADVAAMGSLADTTDLPLRVATLFFGDDGKGEVTTMFAAEVDDTVTAAVKRRFVTVVEARPRDGGKPVRDEYEQEVVVAPGVPTVLSRQWQMPSGVWQLRLLARDTSSGRIGTAIHTFEVPPVGSFRLSTPIVTAALEKAEGRDRPRLSLDRTFRPGQVLYCQYQALGAAVDPAEKAQRVTAGWELRHGDVFVRASGLTRIRPAPDRRLTRLVGVSLDGLEPGDYTLVLSARDEVAGAAARATEPFRVAP